ncbi:MAG: hypothetical protein EXR77_01095 [Myxococcales bacterium]|nr:hypothetical protein [Myxococcales bacterium]
MVFLREIRCAIAVLAIVGCQAQSVPIAADASASSDVVSAKPFDPKTKVYAADLVTGATARYDLSAKDWHGLPWPTDQRRAADGTLDLSGFPPVRDGEMLSLLKQYLSFGQAELRGFSIQPTLYVQFDAALSSKSLVGPLASAKADSPYLVVDIDDGSPNYGQAREVHAALSPEKRGQYLYPNMLMLQPVWGRPLRPQTVYALVVRRALLDNTGKILGQPKVLKDIFSAWAAGAQPTDPATAKYAATLLPLHKAVGAGKVAVPYDDMAAVSVFSTGNPTSQLRSMAQWMRTVWKPDAAKDWKVAKKTTKFWLLEANYHSPNFQNGICPYAQDGSGGFAFDAQGNPKVAKEETLRVSVLVPIDRSGDVGGNTPVVMSAHGTGGDWQSYINGGKYKISDQLGTSGLAIVSIDQPMHGPRCDPPLVDNQLDAQTFNFINITSGRSGFRQSALDSVAMARMIREGLLNVPADFTPDAKPLHLDPQRVAFIGHSQGGLSGALLAAIEPNIATFVLSGAGAGIALTVVQRKDPVDISALVTTFLAMDPGEISQFHPAVSLVQALADATDPLAYGHLMFSREPGIKPPNILLTEGLLDKATPADTSEALAAAIGLDVLAPKVHLNDALLANKAAVLFSPVQDNLKHNGFAVTGLVSQWEKLDHFAIFTTKSVAELYTGFLLSASQTGVSTAIVTN